MEMEGVNGGRTAEERESWQWLDGRGWEYQNGGISSRYGGGHCLLLLYDGLWYSYYCAHSFPFICANPLNRRSGNYTLILRKEFQKSQTFLFWWNHIYTMTLVNNLRASRAFLEMPLAQRNCEAELYEDCRTRKLLEECSWEMTSFQVGI